jgi:hypothetical protein
MYCGCACNDNVFIFLFWVKDIKSGCFSLRFITFFFTKFLVINLEGIRILYIDDNCDIQISMIVGFRLLIMFLTTAALAQGSTSVLKEK